MANPQPDEFTKISNELLEALYKVRIPGESMQCFLVILRKTYGFNKKSDKISLGQFEECTKMPRATCSRAIKKLLSMNLIFAEKKLKITKYTINKDYDSWKMLAKKTTVKDLSIDKNDNKVLTKMITDLDKNDNKVLTKMITTKEKKENIKENNKRKDFIDKIVDVFAAEYLVYRDLEYIFQNGKDRKAAGSLLAHYKQNNPGSNSEKTLSDFKTFFTQCLKITDKWYFENMNLALINSKINEIRNILRKTNVTSQEIRTAVNNNFGE